MRHHSPVRAACAVSVSRGSAVTGPHVELEDWGERGVLWSVYWYCSTCSTVLLPLALPLATQTAHRHWQVASFRLRPQGTGHMGVPGCACAPPDAREPRPPVPRLRPTADTHATQVTAARSRHRAQPWHVSRSTACRSLCLTTPLFTHGVSRVEHTGAETVVVGSLRRQIALVVGPKAADYRHDHGDQATNQLCQRSRCVVS